MDAVFGAKSCEIRNLAGFRWSPNANLLRRRACMSAISPRQESAYIGRQTPPEPLIVRIRLCLKTLDGTAGPTRELNPRAFIKSFGCQMNVYDSERMARSRRRSGLRRGRAGRGRRSHRSQHLPHPRTGVREDLFRARQAARAQGGARAGGAADDAGRGRLRRPGRGGGDPAPPAGGRCRRRSAELSSPAGASARGAQSARRRRHGFPAEDKFSQLARVARRRDSRAAASPPS